MEALSTASSNQPSARLKLPLPCQAAKASTRAQPSTAQVQKPSDGRWRSTSAATTAVPSGSTPVTTAACMASTWRSARARKSGKPTTVPSALTNRSLACAMAGRGARVSPR